MHKFLAVFISFVFAVSSYSDDTKNISSIMLIGNSFFYYNNSLHNHLGDLYDADPDLDTPRRRSITINGSSLSWHDVESYLSNEEIGSFKIDSDTNTYEPYEEKDIDVDQMAAIACKEAIGNSSPPDLIINAAAYTNVEKAEDDHKKFLEYFSKLNTFDESELNDRTKLNLEVAKFSAEIEKMGFENFRYHMGPFIQFYGIHLHFVNFLTDTHKFETKKDAEDYIKRTNAVPKAIDQLMVFEKRRADAGIYSPKFVYEKSFLQVQALAETPTEDRNRETPSIMISREEVINQFYAKLSEEERWLLSERSNGSSWKELAEKLNATPDQLRKRLARVTQRIAAELQWE